MTEEECKANIELDAALRGFDPPKIPEPEEPEPEVPPAPADPEIPEDQDEEEGPDFTNATLVVKWYGKKILELIGSARREKALTKLRALSGALDCWAKLVRLSVDTSEIEQIKQELAELRQDLERTGPRLAK